MLSKIGRIIASLLGAAGIALTPLKTLTAIVIPMIFTYLIYAFLGGFGIALAIVWNGLVDLSISQKRIELFIY